MEESEQSLWKHEMDKIQLHEWKHLGVKPSQTDNKLLAHDN